MKPGILFTDLDGTIMQNPFWPAVFPALGRYLAARTGLSAEEIIRQLTRESMQRRSAQADPVRAMDWDDILQTVALRLGVACDLSAEQLVIESCLPPSIAMLDQADRVLREVTARGWRLVAASHGLSKYQLPVLRALGLLPLFSDIATPDSRLCFKSDRRFWQPYLDSGARCAHMGDLYDDDIVAASSFGMATIWRVKSLPEPASARDPIALAASCPLPAGQTTRPSAVIFSLAELPAVLAALPD